MRCPNCGQENRAGAAFCLQCGTQLGEVAASGTTATSEHSAEPPAPRQAAPTPPVSHEPDEIELTHRGHMFGAGYGADFYGVWDLRVAGEPVARFERTPIGWEAAWRRFQELERRQAVPKWRRQRVGWVIFHEFVGLFGTAVLLGLTTGVLFVVTGREELESIPGADTTITLAAFVGMIAWLMFVYLNKSRRFRWIVFLATLLSAVTVALIVLLVSEPHA